MFRLAESRLDVSCRPLHEAHVAFEFHLSKVIAYLTASLGERVQPESMPMNHFDPSENAKHSKYEQIPKRNGMLRRARSGTIPQIYHWTEKESIRLTAASLEAGPHFFLCPFARGTSKIPEKGIFRIKRRGADVLRSVLRWLVFLWAIFNWKLIQPGRERSRGSRKMIHLREYWKSSINYNRNK